MAEDDRQQPTQTDEERRLHLVMFDYWRSLLRGRQFPRLRELSGEITDRIRDFSFLLEFPGRPEDAVLRFVGRKLATEHGDEEELTGKRVSELADQSIIRRLSDRFEEVRAERVPIGFEAEHKDTAGRKTAYRGILLPFSENGEDIHSIYGVINWTRRRREKEPAEFRRRPEPEPKPAPQPEPAEGPVFEPGPELEDRRGPAELPPAERSGDFAEILEAGKEEARRLPASGTSSRQHLYRTLARALRVFELAQEDPEAYRRKLTEAGIRSQARAPFTPALKLIFGKDYDKTRLTEYAAALAHAGSRGIDSGELENFLAEYPGGIKGCVLAEREARRKKKGGSAKTRVQRNRERALKRKARAVVEWDNAGGQSGGDGDFVLLLARRGDRPDKLEILELLDEPESRIETVLRRLPRNDKG